MPPIRLGAFPPLRGPTPAPETVLTFVRAAAAAGLDHVCTADHVSFFVGAGTDGLLERDRVARWPTPRSRSSWPSTCSRLRHPTLVARQVADLELLAPGRLVLGLGIGGEDPHEYTVCGVDPRTRGRRMDECLEVLRSLLTGTPVTFHGEFFDLDDALILPAPRAPVPLIVGGRSDAAVRRAALPR